MRSRVWLPSLVALLCLFCICTQGYVQFEQVLAPKDEELDIIVATLKATYGRPSSNRWRRIGRTAEDHNCILPGCSLMGEVLNIQSSNVTRYDPDTLRNIVNNRRRAVEISHNPSGGILLQEANSDRWFMMYTFEAPNPGVLYRVRVRLENDTDLASRLTFPVNFGRFGGLWKPRGSSLTPDSVMIGTEGIPPDGRIYSSVECLSNPEELECLSNFDSETYFDILDFMRYFIRTPNDLRRDGSLEESPEEGIPGFKVYRYGFPYTVSLRSLDDDRVVDEVEKLYAVGRTGAHGVAVMQNGVTMYLSGGTGGLFKYEDAGDGTFTSGTLYAARFIAKKRITKISAGDEFDIVWIKLADTNAEELTEEISGDVNVEPLKFSDIFDYAEPRTTGCGGNRTFIEYTEFTECLSVEDETLAAIFEPARFALLKGATIKVFQFSEIATRLNSNKIYIAARSIQEGALRVGNGTSTTPIEGNSCGCVFEIDTEEETGNAVSMKAIMCGHPTPEDLTNQCSTEEVANPRSLTYANNFENLLIGEDSDLHENNYMWSYDPDTGRATRIFSAPLQGAVTSVNWFQDVVGGNNYIGITIAHPYDQKGWLSYLGSFDLTAGEKLTFSSVGVPYAVGPKGIPQVFRIVTTGVAEEIPGFTELIKSGEDYKRAGKDARGTVQIGVVVDEKFKPVNTYEEGPGDPRVTEEEETHHSFGFSSLIDMCGKLYSVVSTNSIPAVSYVFSYDVERARRGAGPKLEVADVDYIDWSEYGGLWRSGSGQVSPWNTHIAGEAFEPDAMDFLGYPCLTGFSGCFKSRAEESFQQSLQFVRYFGSYFDDFENRFDRLGRIFNPYKYGYVYEVKVSKNGCTSPTKYMTLGRFSHGDLQIMPDGKTVYMTDWTEGRQVGGGLFKFVADKRNDLSSGTLYAAQFQPRRGTLKSFDVEWIRLASAKNKDLVKRSDKIKFADIFDSIPGTKSCRLQTINVKSRVECLDVKEGMETYAAFFETRRYAALRKASIELANVKGLVYDPTTSAIFVTINRVTARDKIMLQDDIEGSTNSIKVPLSPCGCVYKMEVTEDYDTMEFREYYCGSEEQGTVGENRCDIEHMANPKDITSIPGHRQIIIAEDSCRLDLSPIECGHVNNALWVVDPVDRRETTRILTGPQSAAITSTVWYPNVGDAAYISVVANELYQSGFDQILNPANASAVFGVIGPFVSPEADARVQSVKQRDPVCYDKNLDDSFTCPAGVKST